MKPAPPVTRYRAINSGLRAQGSRLKAQGSRLRTRGSETLETKTGDKERGRKAPQRSRKPNSVRLRAGFRRRYVVTTIPLVPPSLAGSSDLPGGFGRAVLIAPPYLVLLRAGFCLPPLLPPARCALTAPFHPYPPSREGGRYIFCATVLRVAP